MWNNIPSSYFRYAAAEPDSEAKVTVNLDRVTSGSPFSAGYAVFDRYDGAKPLHCTIHVTLDSASYYQAVSKTILHELGHCLGLGHTLIPEAIMSYSLDKNAFALDVDDEAAVTRLYPADGSKPGLPPGCAVAWPARQNRLPLALILLLPLGAAAAVGRRPRRGSGH